MSIHPPSELRDKILRQAASSPSPSRAQVIRRNALLFVSALALALLEFFMVGGFRAWGAPRSVGLILGTVLGTMAIVTAAAWVAGTQGRSMVGRPRAHLLWLIVLTPMLIFGWKVGFSALFEGGLDDWPERFGNKCLLISLSIGLFPVIAYAVGHRATHPSHPGTIGAAVGVASGACAALLVDLWCPVGHPFHVAYGHIMPMIILGIIGALIGVIALRLRASP